MGPTWQIMVGDHKLSYLWLFVKDVQIIIFFFDKHPFPMINSTCCCKQQIEAITILRQRQLRDTRVIFFRQYFQKELLNSC